MRYIIWSRLHYYLDLTVIWVYIIFFDTRLLFFLIIHITSIIINFTSGLRLVDGNTPNEGRLEMLHEHDTTWRSVELEDSRWNWEVTQVVCKQLGYK